MSELINIQNVLSELEEAFFNIPFENSDYQNRVFVMAAQLTPGRAYRAIGLRMFAKIRAIKELQHARKIEDIDIEEMRDKLNSRSITKYEKARINAEIENIYDKRKWTDKLLNDAIKELDCLYGEFKKLPKYTRELFEAEEKAHFEASMKLQIESKGNGAVESLINMENYEQIENWFSKEKQKLAADK